MSLPVELTDAFGQLARDFYRKPSSAVREWINVDDDVAQVTIALLFGFVDRNSMEHRTEMVIRHRPAYVALVDLVTQFPWDSFFAYELSQRTLSVRKEVSDEEVRWIAAAINSHQNAIESAR